MKILVCSFLFLLCYLLECAALLPFPEIKPQYAETLTIAGREIPGMLYDPRFFSIGVTNKGAWEYTTTDWKAHYVFIFTAEAADLEAPLMVDYDEEQFQDLRKVYPDSQGTDWVVITIMPLDRVILPERLQDHLKAIMVLHNHKPSVPPINPQQETVFVNTMLPT